MSNKGAEERRSQDRGERSRREQVINDDVAEAMADLDRRIDEVESRSPENTAAHDELGTPLIEVLFHLDIGVIASYHNHIVEQDKWLVFVDDNRQPAKQKFIPKPQSSGDGELPKPLKITITGADKQPQTRHIVPLGINFTLGHHDLFVTMVSPPEE